MTYFTKDFNDFFKDLAANNDRDWFNAEKKRYEKAVKKPFEKLVGDLIVALTELEPEMAKVEAKNCIFRIHRDTRFAKDKTPYKMHCSAVLSPMGRKDMELPGTYIQLGVGEIWVGGGVYAPSTEQVEKIRIAMCKDVKGVQKMLEEPKFAKLFGGIKGEQHKRLPKEFAEHAEELPLLFNKQFYYMAEYKDDESIVLKKDLKDWIIEHYKIARDWQDFLRAAIK